MAVLHGKGIQVFAGNLLAGWDISSWLNKVSSEGSVDANETTTFGHNSKTFIGGLLSGKMSFEGIHEFVDATPDTGIDPILFDTPAMYGKDLTTASGDTTVVVLPAGSGGTLADRAYSCRGILTSAPIDSPVDNVVTIKVELTGSHRAEGSVVSLPLASRAGNASATSIDDGAAAPALTGGWAMWVVTTVFSGTSALFELQHSTDNSSWVAVSGASITATSKTVQRVAGTGSLNRYVRVNLTTTSATHTSAAGFTRRYA